MSEIQKSDIARRMEKLSPAKRQLLLKKLAGRSGEGSLQAFRITPRDGEEVPLSYGQSRLWLLEQLDPGSPAYVILAAARLRGRLDVAALRRGLGIVVGRHESLRTILREGANGPFQEVRDVMRLEMPVLSLEALPPERREARLEPLARLMANVPFELSRGPLLRLLLIRLGREEHVLVRAVHHVVSDGWSDAIFYRELLTVYRALAAGEEPRLPDSQIQYADFVRWQRRQLESGAYDDQLAYWREQLAGVPSVLSLPTDRPRPSVVALDGEVILWRCPGPLREALLRLRQESGSSLFTLCLTAFAALLGRWTRAREVCVGTPVAGRNRTELENVVGLLLNTLALRADLSGDPRLSELLKRLDQTTLDALANQEVPFGQVVREVHPERSESHTPLFQVLFSYQPAVVPTFRLPDLTFSVIDVGTGGAQFDLTFLLEERGEELMGTLVYNRVLFLPTTPRRFLRHFENVLLSLVENPGLRFGELSLLSAGERHQVLTEWNDTRQAWRGTGCLHDLFAAQARRTPDATALLFEEQRLSYGELEAKANQLARHLLSLGLQPGEMVGVCLPRSPEMVVAVLAALKAGGGYVPLDGKLPAERLRFMIEDAGVRLLVSRTGYAPAELGETTERVLLDRESEALSRRSVEPPCPVEPRNFAYVIFTSGSTGKPKGVMVRHEPAMRLIAWVNRTFEVGPGDRMLFVASLSFDLSVYDIFGMLAAGGSIRIASGEDLEEPERLVRLLQEDGITFWDSAPAALQQLAPLFPSPGEGSETLRRVFLSGDWIPVPLPDQVRASFPRARVISLGGATECTVWSNFYPIERVDPSWPSIPYGRPMKNARYLVLDPRMGPCPIGVPGDLCIGGHCLSGGYASAPALAAERFVPDPFAEHPGDRLYRTGDLARFFNDGNLEFLGRQDAQVKIRGFRVELGEIETALTRYEGVRDAVAVIDGPSGPAAVRAGRLVAYVVPRTPEAAPRVEDLRVFLGDILPEYMVPSTFMFLDAIPLTANGKLDRKALPSPSGQEETAGFVAPSTPAEELLAGIWRQVLGLRDVGVHDNFFEVGGDSILSIQVVSQARAAGLRLSPRQVFQNPTVAEQAAVAVAAGSAGDEAASVTGPVPLTPIQQSFFASRSAVHQHFNQAVLLAPVERLDAGRLAAASEVLVLHHDALRLRFFQDSGAQDSGAWHQESRAQGGPSPCTVIDLSRVPSDRQAGVLGSVADASHRGFDPSRGALQRLVLLDLGAERAQRLLWVIHHLAVDGVSWRVLLADLESCYRQLERGEAPVLPPRTASFGRWAQALEELGRSGDLAEELDFWTEAGRARAALPVDDPRAPNTVATTRKVEVALAEEETRALLYDVPAVYRTNIDEVLLTALVLAFRKWTGERGLRLALEGHGREEELVGGLDLSRTVGWFTSLYPVSLEVAEGGPGETLKAVKERLRSVPHHGVGYGVLRYLGAAEARQRLGARPDPEVIFNYLGQLDTALSASFWRPAEEASGARADSRGLRESLLEVSGGVQAGRLRLRWEHGARHRRSTVETLARGYLESLRALIDHCRTVGFGGHTPSDFPLADLDQTSLDALLASRGPVEDLYPLTSMQQGMLFHTLYEPGSGTYVEQLSATLRGPLDPERLRRAWRSVVRRHSVLRTAFLWEGLEEPLQLVLEEPRLPWREEDWRELSAAERRERLDAELEDDIRRGFDLDEAPLMRILLIRAGEESWHFAWSYHHLLLDGWSSGLVFRDALAYYRGQEPPGIPPYRAYVAWLREHDLAETEAFWRATLEGFTTPTLLAEGRRGDTRDLAAYRQRETRLAPETTEALRAVAARHSLTLNTLLQGAWSLLLAGTTGRRDVLFGATVSGRSAGPEGRESMVGLFINTLPVRARVEAEGECFPWLAAQQAAHAEAREHEHSPLERVQLWSGFGAEQPLFDHILVFENFPVGAALQEDEDLRPSDVRVFERTNYPLTVDVVPESALLMKLSYEASLFEDTAALRILGHFGHLLSGLSQDPLRLRELSLLGPAERHQLLLEWNVTPPAEAPAAFVELFARQAGATPEAVAAVCEDRRATYRQLDRRTNAVARRLIDAGVDGETVVTILAERGIDFLLAVLSIWKAGGAYLPLDPRHPAGRHRQVLGASGSGLVLVSRELLSSLTEALGEPASCRVQVLEDLVEEAGESSEPLPARGRPENLAYVLYTSGSTGLPKGAMVEQRGMVNHLRAKILDLGIESGDRVAQNASQCFDISIWQFLAALWVGGRVVIYPDEVAHDPARLLAAVREDAVTILEVVPSMMQMMVADEEEVPSPLPRLRWLVPTGEALPVELARRWHGVFPRIPLVNAYGPTECSDDVTHHVLRGPVDAAARTIPIGRPVLSLRLYVLAPDLSPVPFGRPGELFVAGIGVGRGYLSDPRSTATAFLPHPFATDERLYRTGDLGRFTTEGELEFLGRVDHQVKLRGFRIELGEIETALSRHETVEQAVVVMRETASGNQQLVAWLVSCPGEEVEPAALREFLRERLPEHMVPAFFAPLDGLPLSPNGKVDRRALSVRELAADAQSTVAPRTPLEEELVGLWRELLAIETLGVRDNFFHVGGHSLLVTQLFSKIRKKYLVELPLRAFFEAPTVEELAERIELARWADRAEPSSADHSANDLAAEEVEEFEI